MQLAGLLSLVQDIPAYAALRQRAEEGAALPPLALVHSARPFLAAALSRDLARPTLILTARSEQAYQWADTLRAWLPEPARVHLFADPDALPYERITWSRETRQQRLGTLVALTQTPRAGDAPSQPPVIVASARALALLTLPRRELALALRPLRSGQMTEMAGLLEKWLGWGYQPATVVEEPGAFSRRGGIVDVWAPNLPWPLRLELFGNEIDSLRFFDPSTQRTLPAEQGGRVSEVLLGPASEALPRYGPAAQLRLEALDLTPCHAPAQHDFERERSQLLSGVGFRGVEWYIPYLYSQPATLLDYLPTNGLLLVDDGAELTATLSDLQAQAEQLARDLTNAGELPHGALRPYAAVDDLRLRLQARQPVLLGFGDLMGRPVAQGTDLAHAFLPAPHFGSKVRRVVEEAEAWRKAGQRTVLITRQSARLDDLMRAAGQAPIVTETLADAPPPAVYLVPGSLSEGFVLRNEDQGGIQLTVLTDAELFGMARPAPKRAMRARPVAPETFFADLHAGDFVVHMEHGIAQFQGLVNLDMGGVPREYLHLSYAQGDRLYVPVHQADRLSRYVGGGDGAPVLHRLGTADWEHVKQRTRRAVADIADELLDLYAARELVAGHAFAPDGVWQDELEGSFPYVETEDQLAAIEDVKHDMERSRPMDRLICGDVGYGKTEVALRAAFKAIMDGKQVAVLVPTTVLAQQHFTNFSQRLRSYPVNVAMLSRFLTGSRQDEVIEGLLKGSVDLVVGTHRLLSQDVIFKDMGLLIIDEEQRFGVTHKERLKQMRTEVDVLTLTATPIPRTLHMSLTGVRDLSTIDTPPEERLPIKTTLAEYDEQLIRQAILREMDRGGQVYFVHNRVLGIEQLAQRVHTIVPEARIGIGHGQMPERQLEQVMLDFANGECDVLVCTTIIESGLDIPNVNTIIINRADHFGLAQLYQLRGRVGRSAVRAYAYLLYDRGATLSLTARRRIEAILEASELGAGFRIAMHDLEIRGAGEILGARQHGHMTAVGFDLYTRLLAQAVDDARTQRQMEAGADGQGRRHALIAALAPAVTLELPLEARLPEDYIADAGLRLRLYRRLASLGDLNAISDFRQELSDRFGAPPPAVDNLLYQVRVKALATQAGVSSIAVEEQRLIIKTPWLENADGRALQQKLGAPARVIRDAVWLPLNAPDWQALLARVLEGMGGER
ncbi:transcription-repair coupling factor [Candidatus Amarolinea dominans]|uniref:transcription-repair coupling factor n=1 Tax=Candidatus Amarolinea dominans TaxID=3140696 RepID=UPI00313570EC|nr:transcription-repair coupling factor [Anaerolineae bacterium]